MLKNINQNNVQNRVSSPNKQQPFSYVVLFKMTEEQTTMTTGVLSPETETRTSFWVVTNRPHSGGGSEMFAIVLRFVDITINAPDCFVKFFRVGPWGQSQQIHIQLFGLRNHGQITTRSVCRLDFLFGERTTPCCFSMLQDSAVDAETNVSIEV